MEESVCCKNMKINTEHHGRKVVLIGSEFFENLTFKGCITENGYIDMILNPVMLEISLRNIWSVAGYALEDKTLSNKYVKTNILNLIYFYFTGITGLHLTVISVSFCSQKMKRRKTVEPPCQAVWWKQ